jgi:hypothetical protein
LWKSPIKLATGVGDAHLLIGLNAVADLEREMECKLWNAVARRNADPLRHNIGQTRSPHSPDVDAIRSICSMRKMSHGHVRLAMPIGGERLTRPVSRLVRVSGIQVDIADGTAHDNRVALLEGLADLAVIHQLERRLPLNSDAFTSIRRLVSRATRGA